MTQLGAERLIGAGGLEYVRLSAADGAVAAAYIHGSHVTSWVPAGGAERLYLSERSVWRTGAAIRGGVPVIFPQFAGRGPLPKHGFARSVAWTYAGATQDAHGVTARFTLATSPATLAIWPHAFAATLSVGIGGQSLTLTLAVENRDAKPFAFTAALHTYVAVGDIARTAVTGLAGLRYADSAAGGTPAIDQEPAVRFAGEVDRIYWAPSAPVRVDDGARTTEIAAEGFTDVVVWNPGAEKGAALADLEADGQRRFVCVEAATVGAPVMLLPNAAWQGTQRLVAAP